MANIYDVARLAKVSTATVSKVLSNTPYVSQQTKKRVLEAIEKLQYSPSLAARSLTGSRTYVIGLVVPYDPDYLFSDPFLLEVIRGVESVANDNDYNVLISMAKSANQRSAYTKLVRTGYVDGAVTLETFEGNIASKVLEEQGIPFVSIGYSDAPNRHNSVSASDYTGAHEAISYLIKLGHSRIGIIGGPSHFMSALEERMRGINDALQAYSLSLDSSLLTYGDFTLDSGYRACNELLSSDNRPTAIFAMNDRMAMGAMRCAREYELHIPHDLSLVGFDDIPMAVLVEPPLTTVRQPAVEMGRCATQKLLEMINADVKEFESIVLPAELIIRSSAAAPHWG
jgi:DNA-binding LacI/PurR family transcriptional regulator